HDTPLIRFHSLLGHGRPPQRADRSACGTLPTRAFRYCEAATSAAAFGWWAFPPVDLRLMWDGTDIFWYDSKATDWTPLLPDAPFPGFPAAFDAAAPADALGCAPPFLTSLPEPGTLQIWTGLIVRSAPGWHLLVRAPANLPLPGGYALYEGIVETDRWFGPLFTNLRFTRSHVPIRLRADFPLIQMQPLPRGVYAEETLASAAHVSGVEALSEVDWDAYRTTIVRPSGDPDRGFGAYAAATRKRRRHAAGAGCPFAGASRDKPGQASGRTTPLSHPWSICLTESDDPFPKGRQPAVARQAASRKHRPAPQPADRDRTGEPAGGGRP
ncbi:MAG TPA: DUF6065 family protein, partial [Acetobacteraceae bacterium]|nr:DUF6065 family protein [Acetobacteraceae bacterium]